MTIDDVPTLEVERLVMSVYFCKNGWREVQCGVQTNPSRGLAVARERTSRHAKDTTK